MGIKENLYYWEESLKNPEPLIDPLYISDELIVEDRNLINKIWQLRDEAVSKIHFTYNYVKITKDDNHKR